MSLIFSALANINNKKCIDMKKEFYVLSLRNINKSPAQCCIVEFEDVIIENLAAKLIYTSHKLNGSENNLILFVVGLSIYDIDKALRSINTDSFCHVFAYVFDAFASPVEFKKPNWRKFLSTHHRTIRKITHLFVPFRQSVCDFERIYQIPVHYMPLGVDALKYGGYDEHKVIDVNGYGRQHGPLEQMLAERFNARNSNSIFLHTNHQHVSFIHNTYDHRRLFWQKLRKSKIALAFDPIYADLNNRFPFSFVGQRWFESTSAGCVIVGKRPICTEMYELFDWPDATIELPDNANEMADFIKYMLNNYDLESIGRRNSEECLRRHDWRHRLVDMLKIMKIEAPRSITDQLVAATAPMSGEYNLLRAMPK